MQPEVASGINFSVEDGKANIQCVVAKFHINMMQICYRQSDGRFSRTTTERFAKKPKRISCNNSATPATQLITRRLHETRLNLSQRHYIQTWLKKTQKNTLSYGYMCNYCMQFLQQRPDQG